MRKKIIEAAITAANVLGFIVVCAMAVALFFGALWIGYFLGFTM